MWEGRSCTLKEAWRDSAARAPAQSLRHFLALLPGLGAPLEILTHMHRSASSLGSKASMGFAGNF